MQDLCIHVVLLQIEKFLIFGDIPTYFLNSQAYYPSEGQPLCSLFSFAEIQSRYMEDSVATDFLLHAFHFSAHFLSPKIDLSFIMHD